jgi:SAM-dependent methyltransferase
VSDAQSYPGRDLEAMVFAKRYHTWILDLFTPYLGGDVLEVGAGSGNFSRMLLSCDPASLLAIEPSPEMFSRLCDWAATDPRVRVHRGTLGSADVPAGNIDSILYVNVLEHIQDDAAELAVAYAALRPGGTLLLYVPALSFLYSDFDRRIGHYRRYEKTGLEHLAVSAGFQIERCHFVDLLGVLPWYVSMRLLKGDLSPRAVALYDLLGTPITRWLEAIVTPPVGKNLALIGRKPLRVPAQ